VAEVTALATTDPDTASGLPVNWGLARRTAARLVPAGPPVTPAAATELVERLRSDAAVAEGHVRAVTGLGDGLPLLPADVVDRPAWAAAAVDGMAELTSGAQLPRTAKATRAVTATTSGLQIGGVLAFVGARVLGQYDPFGGPDREGRLLLVAPNIYAAQQALDVPAEDFGLWVCLHEATHRLQFTAVPWLREHFAAEVSRFLSVTTANGGAMLERLPEAVKAIKASRGDSLALVELLQGPEQKAVLDRLLALTTLVEGHADHVMDAAGPEVVPSVATIRSRFTARRRGGGLVDRVLRALLGVEAKVKQYAVGSAFTKHVVGEVGMAGFNKVWQSPDTLPTRSELSDPQSWLTRVA
jgi:coenzyme F420 biosynthesis associated uncharacterized protein